MGRPHTCTTSTVHEPDDPRRRRSRIIAAIALGALAVVAVAGCSDADDESADSDATEQTAASGTVVGPAEDAPAASDSDLSAAGVIGNADVAGGELAALGRDIAIEMHVTMTSADLRRTVQGILRSAAAHGGAVFASDIDYGTDDEPGAAVTGRATLTVKVPPAELDAVLTGLDELGTVLSTNQQAQDVTEQLVDLSVRIRNAEQSVDRVRDFLEATTDLGQMVDLEGELTRRQTDLERLLATQASLTERVALSTLTIDVYPANTPVDTAADDHDGIGDAFRAGWDAFLGVVFAIGFVLAILAPFLVLAALVVTIAWIVARPRRRRPAANHIDDHSDTSAVSVDEDLARANHPG